MNQMLKQSSHRLGNVIGSLPDGFVSPSKSPQLHFQLVLRQTMLQSIHQRYSAIYSFKQVSQ